MERLFEISGFNIYMQLVVTIVSFSLHMFFTRNKNRKESVIELICIYTIGLAGWFSITSGFFGHLLYADQVANSIGWPLQSGFQMELAFASIGIGLTGFLGFWNRSFGLPFIIAKSTFMAGAGLTHIIHMIKFDNLSPSNVGIVVYWDFLLPIVLITLYSLFRMEQKRSKTQ